MANSYQLVAWTQGGQVRMIPSEVNAFVDSEMELIDRLAERIRYRTDHETGDILRVSRAYERLAIRLLDLGRYEDAFFQYAQAAECCCSGEWRDCEDYDDLAPALRGRFFAMYARCRDITRQHPRLRYSWQETGLSECFDSVTEKDRWIRAEYLDLYGDIREAQDYSSALNFGKDEVYRHRRG